MFGAAGTANTILTVISGQEVTEMETDAIHPDTTYALRVQAVRATTLGSFVVAESKVTTYAAP
jgi:hypothetical protein